MTKYEKRFALQMGEATDRNKDCCLLIAYVILIDGEDLREDLLFCKRYQSNCRRVVKNHCHLLDRS